LFILLTLVLLSCKKEKQDEKEACTKPARPKVISGALVAYGSSIKLECSSAPYVTLYEWQGPNNFNSIETSPTIYNVSQLNTGIYKVRLKVEGGCYSDYAEFPVTVSLPYPTCIVSANTLQFGSLASITFGNNSQMGIGTSGNYEYTFTTGATTIHVQYSKPSFPLTGLYRSVSSFLNPKGDEVIMTLNYGGHVWKANSGNGLIYISATANFVEIKFCKLSFKNQTNNQVITDCNGVLTKY
jgi:hypothetical protein